MSIDSVRDALHKQPFQPFIIRLADGRSVYVAHPDFVAVSPRQVHVISPVDESVSWLEPLLIVSIEFVGAAKTAPAPDGNGV
jgi:hypothetical protein